MSEQQKAPIRDVQVDEILAQVEKKRASHGGKTPKASEAQLDAILKSMGLGEAQAPALFRADSSAKPCAGGCARKRGACAGQRSAGRARGRRPPPAGRGRCSPMPGSLRPRHSRRLRLNRRLRPSRRKSRRKSPPRWAAHREIYAVIEDQEKEAERQRMLEQARLEVRRREQAEREKAARAQAQRVRKMEQAKREAAFTIHNSAQFAVQDALAAHMRQKASEAAAAAGEKPVEAPAPAAPGPAPARPNALFGEVDDQFRAFFSTTVATNREDVQRARRKKEGRRPVFPPEEKEPADTAELAALWGEEASESFTQELGNLGAIRDAIDQQKAQAPGAAAAAGEKPMETPAPARAAAGGGKERSVRFWRARARKEGRRAQRALANIHVQYDDLTGAAPQKQPIDITLGERCPRRTPPSRRAAAFRWRAKRWTNMSRSAMRPPWRKTWTTCAARACCAPWPAAFRPCCFSTLALRAAPGCAAHAFPRRKTRLCSCL